MAMMLLPICPATRHACTPRKGTIPREPGHVGRAVPLALGDRIGSLLETGQGVAIDRVGSLYADVSVAAVLAEVS